MRRRTKPGPIGGADDCNCESWAAYSGGTASGIVDSSCATFMIGPLRPPSAAVSSAAARERSPSMPSMRWPATLAATAPTLAPTLR